MKHHSETSLNVGHARLSSTTLPGGVPPPGRALSSSRSRNGATIARAVERVRDGQQRPTSLCFLAWLSQCSVANIEARGQNNRRLPARRARSAAPRRSWMCRCGRSGIATRGRGGTDSGSPVGPPAARRALRQKRRYRSRRGPSGVRHERTAAACRFLWCVSPPTGRAAGPPFGTRVVEWPAQTAPQGHTAPP